MKREKEWKHEWEVGVVYNCKVHQAITCHSGCLVVLMGGGYGL